MSLIYKTHQGYAFVIVSLLLPSPLPQPIRFKVKHSIGRSKVTEFRDYLNLHVLVKVASSVSSSKVIEVVPPPAPQPSLTRQAYDLDQCMAEVGLFSLSQIVIVEGYGNST